jgi:DNA-binding CsgD family transcriptional regulator
VGTIFDLVVNSADGVFGVSDDQRIVFWNHAAEQILEIPAEDVLGSPCHQVLGGNSDSLCMRCRQDCGTILRAREGRGIPTRDVHARLPDGREQWLSISTLVVPSRWQHLAVVIHLFRDNQRSKEIEAGVMTLVSHLERLGAKQPPSAGESLPAGANGKLSGREREVLQLLASGNRTRDIARLLSISPATVRNHVGRILSKLGVHTRLEAVAHGLKTGLIPRSS